MNKFICIEGCDGVGKSTQSRALHERIEGSVLVREPGGTEISSKIRQILLDPENKSINHRTELLLFMAARAQLVDEIIRPALEAGKIVIADRFLPSTVAYQQGVRINDVVDIGKFAVAGIMPDVTYILDMDAEKALERKHGKSLDRIEQKSLEFHHQVRNRYCILRNQEPGKYMLMNAELTEEQVHEAIWNDLKIRGMVL